MSRWIVALLCLSGCSIEATLSPSWAGSVLRIVEPLPASVLPIEASHRLVAGVANLDGDVVEVDGIDWVTSGDPEWAAAGSLVEDGLLPNGAQELTAEVILPNGDRLAHTIGDVRVQSRYAGTYAGLFSATVDTQGVQAPCSGAAVVVAARAVGVAVFPLFFRRIANLDNLDIEIERLTGQRVVGIHVHIESPDLEHRDLRRPPVGLQVQDHAPLQLVGCNTEFLEGNTLHIGFLALTVSFCRRH